MTRLPSLVSNNSPSLNTEGLKAHVLNQQKWRELALCSSDTARALIPYTQAKHMGVLPLSCSKDILGKDILKVISTGSLSVDELKQLKFLTNCEVETEVSQEGNLERAISVAYFGDAKLVDEALNEAEQELPDSANCFENFAHKEKGVPGLLNSILTYAIVQDVSDIHFEPSAKGCVLAYRIDGILNLAEGTELSATAHKNLARRIKVLAKLDTTLERVPQEGSFVFKHERQEVHFRISIVPTVLGEKIVLRLHDLNQAWSEESSLSSLGLHSEQIDTLNAAISSESGVILLAGPTGSGKSTLLYSLLELLKRQGRHIVTLEDPVERIVTGCTQIEVNREQGYDYADLLPVILRQDPDVIMLGEVRDRNTSKSALEAGLSGHLVLSTIHAANSLEVFLRLNQLGVESFSDLNALKLIVSQRLIPTNCQNCIERHTVDRQLAKIFHFQKDEKLSSSKGCKLCRGSGVRGRVGVFELLSLTENVREVLRSKEKLSQVDTFSLSKAAFAAGYRPYALGVRELLSAGIISPFSTLRCLGISAETDKHRFG